LNVAWLHGRATEPRDGAPDAARGLAVTRWRAAGWPDSAVVLLVALLARLLMAAWAGQDFPPVADGSYYHRLASRLAAGHGYTWLWPDGVVTFAAHYPVGYPAMLAGPYAVLGAEPGLAMFLNALLGALAALAVHRLLSPDRRRVAAFAGGLLVALHPGLVGYVPALMTGGVAAAWVALAAWCAGWARRAHRRRARLWRLGGLGLLIGAATLVRPESLLLGPLFGLVAVGRRRGYRWMTSSATLVTAVALLVCAPWTWRNCRRMQRCALVSVNGGWNLLIGTDPRGKGGWAPLEVPEGCRTVFDEAQKDACFEREAWRRVDRAPGAWLALAPAKLAATFDYCGAAGWYLHESNPRRFPSSGKLWLGVIESGYERLVLLLALAALWPMAGCDRRHGVRRGASALWLLLSALLALTRHGWLAHLGLLIGGVMRRPRLLRSSVPYGAAAAVLGCLALVHVVFFGGGRYQLPLLPLLCAQAGLGVDRLRGQWSRRRG